MRRSQPYDWMDGAIGFYLAAGPQHLDGKHALAYVRSRKSAGDNEFGRSVAQQQVLIALLHKMAEPSQILNLPGLISTLGSSVTTNFPAGQVADYIAIGQNIPESEHHECRSEPFRRELRICPTASSVSTTTGSPRSRSSSSAGTAPGMAALARQHLPGLTGRDCGRRGLAARWVRVESVRPIGCVRRRPARPQTEYLPLAPDLPRELLTVSTIRSARP